ENLLNPRFRSLVGFGIWSVNRLEASPRLLNHPIEIRGYPINGANDLVGVQHDSLYDPDMHNANAPVAFAEKSLDCDSIAGSNLCGPFRLMACFPSEHPNSFFYK